MTPDRLLLLLLALSPVVMACSSSASESTGPGNEAGVVQDSSASAEASGPALDASGVPEGSPEARPEGAAPLVDGGEGEEASLMEGGVDAGVDAGHDAGVVSGACSSCMETSCDGAYGTCEADTDCTPIEACWENCAALDENCQYACLTGHMTGISQAFLLADCAARECPSSCTWAAALPGCYECLYSMAPADANACLPDVECYSWLVCTMQCGTDYTCYMSCPTADAPAQAVLNDLQNVCSDYCQVI
jgi:hypothetical protein